MKDELFQELLESVTEGGAIMKGAAQPSRSFEFPAAEVRIASQHPEALLDLVDQRVPDGG